MNTDVETLESTDFPPADFVVEEADDSVDDADDPADCIGPPELVIQDTVSCYEVQLPVAQFSDCANDLALFTCAVNHGMTEAALADFLKRRSRKAEYQTPYLMRKFIEACVNVETREVDCCSNGCDCLTHKRAQATACGVCGSEHYTPSGKPACQMKYWLLTAWLVNVLCDPVLGPGMMAGM